MVLVRWRVLRKGISNTKEGLNSLDFCTFTLRLVESQLQELLNKSTGL